MGNYRQHLGFAGFLGVGYAAATFLLAGIHWLYGTVAALLTTISGLLPDLDSDSGVEMKGFTGMLGVLVAVAVWEGLGKAHPPPAFELHLWATVISYVAVRHGIRRIASRLTVHRGISHSIPTGAVWGALVYLHYPSNNHSLRVMMAVAVMGGFLSHLLLDEICSVDLSGARVNKAFGTAIKFWAPSVWSTVAIYLLLSYLTWHVLEQWPQEDLWTLGPPPPEPRWPFRLQVQLGDSPLHRLLRR